MSSHAMPGPWDAWWETWGRNLRFDLSKIFALIDSAGLGERRDSAGPGGHHGSSRHHEHHEHHEHHGPRGHRGRGPGGFGGRGPGGWPFGKGGFPGPGFGRSGPRVGRGDVREALLALLAEQPMHGYQMIGELTARSGGHWRPSPGSVYPVLSMLADEGLVCAEESDGRRVFHLTNAGRAHVEARAGEPRPWETAAAAADDDLSTLRTLAFGVGAAVVQVAQTGDEAQVAAAREVLTETRRSLYRILAGDMPEPSSTAGPATATEDDGSAEDADRPTTGTSGTDDVDRLRKNTD